MRARLSLCALAVMQACAGAALADDASVADSALDAAMAVAAAPSAGDEAAALASDDASLSADDKALLVRQPPVFRFPYTLPGAFAFRTRKGYYLTAINGGGRYLDPTIITASPTAGSWEQFRIRVDPSSAYDKSFITMTGNYVTAVNGGGMTSNALHTDATVVGSWEQFRMIDLAEQGFAPTYYALYTINGHVVTAAGAGGQYVNAIHTDGYQVGSWEELRPDKCGDLGSGYDYYIIPADNQPLTAADGGGHADDDAIIHGYWFGEPDNKTWSRFTLLRQSDGTYALRTSNGANYVTALGGGGLVQEYVECDPGWYGACIDGVTGIFHTDATQVLGWEKFHIVDTGECKYTIQTSSGFFVGIYSTPHGMLLTTRRNTISENEKFEFVMATLGSPPIIH